MYKGIDFVAHFKAMSSHKLNDMHAAASLLFSDPTIDKICPDLYRLGVFMEQAIDEQKKEWQAAMKSRGHRATRQKETGGPWRPGRQKKKGGK
jgi:hypothetical protein